MATGAQGPCSKWVGGWSITVQHAKSGDVATTRIEYFIVQQRGTCIYASQPISFTEQDTPSQVVDDGPGLMIPGMAQSAGRMTGYIHHCGPQRRTTLLCTATSPRPANADSRTLSGRPTQPGGLVFVQQPRETLPVTWKDSRQTTLPDTHNRLTAPKVAVLRQRVTGQR